MTDNKTPTPAIPAALSDPLRNRGVAFTPAKRDALGLTGRLPAAVLTLGQQAERAHRQLQAQPSDLAKNVYLEQLHGRNEVLYYRVLIDHLAELLPVVYDPTVGEAIEKYSNEYRRPRGIFLSIDRPDDMAKAFATLALEPGDVDLIVCSDAEQILGIGDWGVGGIQIAVGKLAVYTAVQRDHDRLRAGMRIALSLLAASHRHRPGRRPARGPRDADLDGYIKAATGPYFHPVGTARIGTDKLSVVDPELNVHGITGLQVADASVFPTIRAAIRRRPPLPSLSARPS